MMRRIFPILLAASLFLPSCKEDKITGEPITISRIGDELNLINQTEKVLYYFLVDQNSLALIDWAPSVSEDQARLASRGQARVKFEDITVFSGEDASIVCYYWETILDGTEVKPGPVNSIVFEL